MEEMFDTYDINGNFLGVKPKSFCHSENPGVYHKPVWIWIVNSKNEVLVQKRASTKKFMAGMWDTPSAGHVEAGEDFIVACQRETEEELGIKVNKNEFIFLGEIVSQKVWEIGQVYLLKKDIDYNKFKLQKNEVEEVNWLSFSKFKNLFYSDKFVPYDKSYKDWVCQKICKNLNL